MAEEPKSYRYSINKDYDDEPEVREDSFTHHQNFPPRRSDFLPLPTRPKGYDVEELVEAEEEERFGDEGEFVRKFHVPVEILEELDMESQKLLKKLIFKLEKRVRPVENWVRKKGHSAAVLEWLDRFMGLVEGDSNEEGIPATRGLNPAEEDLVSKLERFKIKTLDVEGPVKEERPMRS
ncbi:hypothetical protein Nepgr_032006 [Nepenthes gracilis]|uniref:Uncharacterized protein n=1 Tax=Nepenthes gracilis TaxID=150966 RepID=A0AAD3Y5Q6_NEPGR|nr:hypothetical protein Nepgr_032006 [Nepenthes gracilis]